MLVRRRGAGDCEFREPEDGSDFVAEWRAYQFASDMRFDLRRCVDSGILARGAREVSKSLEQLERTAVRMGLDWEEVDFDLRKQQVGQVMLASFSDRLAVRLGEATLAFRVVGGRRGNLDAASAVKKAQAFIATEITEVEGKEVTVYLHRCCGGSLDGLRALFP